MTIDVVRTKYRDIPCEIVHQRLATRSETVFWLNPEGVNLPHWPMAHRTIHGLSEAQWEQIKAQAEADKAPDWEWGELTNIRARQIRMI
jgi:hypothetical protein